MPVQSPDREDTDGSPGAGGLTRRRDAPVWRRAIAFLLDEAVAVCATVVLLVVIYTNISLDGFPSWSWGCGVVTLYQTLCIAWRGQTLGAYVTRIRVLDAGGNRLSFDDTLIRAIVPVVIGAIALHADSDALKTALFMVLLVAYANALWDGRNRTLWDRLAGSRVITGG